jgi:hypothetical protein
MDTHTRITDTLRITATVTDTPTMGTITATIRAMGTATTAAFGDDMQDAIGGVGIINIQVSLTTCFEESQSMRIKLIVATGLLGTLLATYVATTSAQATSVPALTSIATPKTLTLVRHGGGFGGHVGGHAFASHGGSFSGRGGHVGHFGGHPGGTYGRSFSHGGHGGHFAYSGGRHHAYGAGRNYAYSAGRHYGYAGRHYAYRGDYGRYARGGHYGRYAYYDHHRHYGYYGRYHRYRYYSYYGWPYISYGYYGGGCGWLYRRAVATGSRYWWNRYYACVGYY